MHNFPTSIALSAILKAFLLYFPMVYTSTDKVAVQEKPITLLNSEPPQTKNLRSIIDKSRLQKNLDIEQVTGIPAVNNVSYDNILPDWQPGITIIVNDTSYNIEYIKKIGDANGDGFNDVAVQVQVQNFIDEGYNNVMALIFYGSPTGINDQPEQQVVLNTGYPWFEHINNVGDINGDGFNDMIFGARKLFFGSITGYIQKAYHLNLSWISNEQDGMLQGFEGGDVNGDGYDDILINDNASGFTFMLFGSSGNPDSQPDWIAPPFEFNGNDNKPYITTSAGDINNDGYDDIFLNAEIGYALLFLGSPSGPGQIPVWQSAPKEYYGYMEYYRKIIAGDFTGDGFSDILVHEHVPSPGRDDYMNMIYLFKGIPDGISSDSNIIINEFIVTREFPVDTRQTITFLGDLNDDGIEDFAYGSRIIFGHDIGVDQFPAPNDYYSELQTLEGIGDLNGDDIPEIIGRKFQQPWGIYYTGYPDIQCQELVEVCDLGPDGIYAIPQLQTAGNVISVSYRLDRFIQGRPQEEMDNDASGKFPGNTTIYWRATSGVGLTRVCTTSVIIKSTKPTPVTIKPNSAHPKGDPNTFYIGYGAEAFRIEALPAGGGGPYTYLWSNGSTEKNPRISESVPGEYPYWVKMTNVHGCEASDTAIIKVENALCSSPLVDVVMSQYPAILQNPLLANLIKSNSKIAVCKDGQTMCFTKAVVDIRIERAGYTIGACTPGVIPAEAFMTDEMEEILRGGLKVIVAPNPSSHAFQLNVVSIYNAPVAIRIMDLAGRQVEVLNNAASNQTITVGHKLRAGTYIAEVISGKERKVVKLVKMN